MGALKLTQTYTAEEYFAIDESSEFRYEYINGDMYAMAGSSMNHNEISLSMASSLRDGIKKNGKKCKTFMSDVRLYIENRNRYFYPDVMITCNEADIKNGKNAENPSLIVEVLSESTSDKDFGDKLFSYMQIPSLQYYLILSQEKVFIHLYERKENGWYVQVFDGSATEIELSLLEISLSVSAIYENIIWDNVQTDT